MKELGKMEREKGDGMKAVESVVGKLNYFAALIPEVKETGQ